MYWERRWCVEIQNQEEFGESSKEEVGRRKEKRRGLCHKLYVKGSAANNVVMKWKMLTVWYPECPP
jgi:hypothetical protein